MPSRKPSVERIEQVRSQFQVLESKVLEACQETGKEKHFKLLYDTALDAVDADLSKTAYRLWIYLSANYPFSDREVDLPSQTELGIRLGVTRQAINIAAAELQAIGLWDFWAERWKGRNLKGFGTPKEKGVEKTGQVSKKDDTVSKRNDTCKEKVTPCQKKMTPCQKNLTPSFPEPLPQADSEIPQTIQTYSDLNQTTTNSVVAEEEVTSEPNSQNHQPTQEEVKAAIQEISQLSPEIKTNSTVTKYVIKFWANFPTALEATKKAVREGNLKNPTGFFMEALKNPSEAPESLAVDMKIFPPTPTEKQKEELRSIGLVDGLIITDRRYPSVFCCHVLNEDSKWLLWWEALGLELNNLLKADSNGT